MEVSNDLPGLRMERNTEMYKEIERHENCTVIISEDENGNIDISWYKNDEPPRLIITDFSQYMNPPEDDEP